jgi:hypothetical protein
MILWFGHTVQIGHASASHIVVFVDHEDLDLRALCSDIGETIFGLFATPHGNLRSGSIASLSAGGSGSPTENKLRYADQIAMHL